MLRFPPAGPLARLCPGHYAVCARDVAWARRKYGSGGGTTTPSVTIQSQHFATLQILCSAAKSASGSCTSANPDEMMHIRLFASEPACNYPRLLSLHFLQKKSLNFGSRQILDTGEDAVLPTHVRSVEQREERQRNRRAFDLCEAWNANLSISTDYIYSKAAQTRHPHRRPIFPQFPFHFYARLHALFLQLM